MEYVVRTAIKCSDGKVHRLSYDLSDQTEGSVLEFGRVFTEIEKRFPDVLFWIQKYSEPSELKALVDKDIDSQLIHKPYFIHKPYTDNEV